MLTCVGVGDICNKGRNFVVAVGAEGWFHLFDINASAAKSDSSSQQDGSVGDEQKHSFTQHIPANTKVMLISDIDGDGRCELVVGYTDRVVRAFRWEEPPDASDMSAGQLVLLKKWLLEGQVDSLSVNPSPEGLPELMVSQPGCGYAILTCSWTQEGASGPGDENTANPSREGSSRDVVLHLTTGRIHNKNVSTHLIGSISRGSEDDSSKGGLFALCTLDGTIKLLDSSENLLWSVQVDHQLFALQKLDVTGSYSFYWAILPENHAHGKAKEIAHPRTNRRAIGRPAYQDWLRCGPAAAARYSCIVREVEVCLFAHGISVMNVI
ncbi:KICSTOR complex protein ITFG2 isoform X2 [Triplophysa rosa]|uniref:KICSTOR complex protein ITFG2 isoform X2 n=1 Tax=Triplophysa rosa TaxID=992332 RepID=UPI002545CD1D|nr:KICSTOR complex protein ITFG2 isoform X2 [Triplophysa rosa]